MDNHSFTIPSLVNAQARAFGNKLALISNQNSFTYFQIHTICKFIVPKIPQISKNPRLGEKDVKEKLNNELKELKNQNSFLQDGNESLTANIEKDNLSQKLKLETENQRLKTENKNLTLQIERLEEEHETLELRIASEKVY